MADFYPPQTPIYARPGRPPVTHKSLAAAGNHGYFTIALVSELVAVYDEYASGRKTDASVIAEVIHQVVVAAGGTFTILAIIHSLGSRRIPMLVALGLFIVFVTGSSTIPSTETTITALSRI